MPDAVETRIAEIQARCDAATPGPWEAHLSGYSVLEPMDDATGLQHGLARMCQPRGAEEMVDNQTFIAHARSDVPWLLERVRTLQAALAWECEARDRAFALARRLEEQVHYLASRNRPTCYQCGARGDIVGEGLDWDGTGYICAPCGGRVTIHAQG